MAPDYKKIIAVEPDFKNFRKLMANTEQLKNITLVNAAVGSETGTVPFKMSGGRNSAKGKSNTLIEQISVDELGVQGNSYIKFDVEGEEVSAIQGAEETIKSIKPILNIAAYHKNSDIFYISILVKKLNPDYNVFMRHHPYIPAWDTNYYFF